MADTGRRAWLVGGAKSPLAAFGDLMAVTGVAFAAPVLDSFGRAPEAFTSRGAAPWEVVVFGVVVLLGPSLVLLGAEAGVWRAFGAGWSDRLHGALVAVGSGVAAAYRFRQLDTVPVVGLVLVALAVGVVVALVRTLAAPARTFVRWAGAASVWYLVAFLVLSPAGDLVVDGGDSGRAGAEAAEVAGSLPDDAPPVVVVVLDALPTVSVLDGRGGIDGDIVPHLADLAADATWYRNHTTVSGWTIESLGAIASGTYSVSTAREDLGDADHRNLLTMLSAGYDVQALEPVTNLCPDDVCDRPRGGALGSLLADAASLWWGRGAAADETSLPGALDDDRLGRTERWIDALPLQAGDRPDLVFLHAVLPHDPWVYLPDGRRYEATSPPAGLEDDVWTTDRAAALARQRHLLQVGAADRLVGRLVDRLRGSGLYDEALVVVIADHGIAFTADEPSRRVTAGQFEQIAWTPLLMKAPGQDRGRVVDDDVRSIDVLPTIAAELGVDVPWRTDGVAAGSAPGRGGDKQLIDWPGNELATPGDDGLVDLDSTTGFRRVLTADPVAADGPDGVWQLSPTELFGQRVDGLTVGAPAGWRLAVDDLDRHLDADQDDDLSLELTGEVGAAGRGQEIAVAVNGIVATVTRADATDGSVAALLAPGPFAGPGDELLAYAVEVVADEITLRPVPLTER